jgi:phosphoribosylanthranilate isomerase
MWVKICANTSLEDAQLAASAGADAVGFVFAESMRKVTPAEVRAITPHLPEAIEKYGIFVDTRFEEIAVAITECGLTGVQIHTPVDPALPQRLRERFPAAEGRARLRIIRAVHYGSDWEERVREAAENEAVDAVLVDSRTATMAGGTGRRFDWQDARANFLQSARTRLIVAGGLNPENVAEAIETLRPWGVDVASGVEASPGRKDPLKVKAFVENARIAASKAKLEVEVEA